MVYGYGEIELYTNNAIDMSEYTKIHFDMDYQVVYGENDWRCHFYYGVSDFKIIDVPGTTTSSGKLITLNLDGIKNSTGNHKPYFRVKSCSSNGPVWVTIRAIYLTK